MRESVRSRFVEFTSPMEGVVGHMYLDVKGLVTTAIGNLIDPMQIAMTLPWTHFDGTFASRSEIASEWMRVKSDPVAAKRGHRYTEGITQLRLTPAGIDLVVSKKLEQMGQYLTSRFPDFEEWNACAQLATLSMSWACGPAFRFPALDQCLRARDFDGAAVHCTINETGNPGVKPRNVAMRILYRNAARVRDFKLDPSTLVWDRSLSVDDTPTLRELPAAEEFPHESPVYFDEEPPKPAA